MLHSICYGIIFFLLVNVYGLNKFIDDYETINYKAVNTQRAKRSTDPQPIRIRFSADNRTFHLVLLPLDRSSSPFHDNFVIDEDGGYLEVDPHDFLYEGHVEGDPGSRVYGSILDGVFDGHIHLSDGHSYTIDKAAKYFPVGERPSQYHSIIYHDKHINHRSFRVKRDTNGVNHVDDHHSSCGLEGAKDWMRTVQLAVAEDEYEERPDDILTISSHARTRRALGRDSLNRYSVRTCSMYFQADQKLFEEVRMKEGNKDPVRTREEIVSLFFNHIKAVNEIYENTDFDGITGIQFVIQRVSVYTPADCDRTGRATAGSDNPFCEENVDVSNYLNLNSKKNHSAFCLAYALTFRDFVGGTLGLAWVASPQINTAGGICQVHQLYNDQNRGNTHRSLNTGIVTLVNYGNRVPPRVSQLTLAHEIGHNFGSPHDFPADCQPGLPQGNFIMFASATSGDKPNNAKFSPCSVRNISSVLNVVLRSPPIDPTKSVGSLGSKRNCFQERKSAFCGNQIWEGGPEECDCGFTQSDCDTIGDKCCVPHDGAGKGGNPGACKRKRGAVCSPSQGYCCNGATCSLYSDLDAYVCRKESDCAMEQMCDGRSTLCPPSPPKPDGLECQDSTKVCSNGTCTGSVCEVFGLKDCFLTEGPPERLCYLACIKDGKCVSSMDLPEFAGNRSMYVQNGRHGQRGIILRPGSPCNNYKGYCDIFRKCRSVDANGPLARLKNLIFDKRTIESVSAWAQERWWAVVAGGVVLLIFMALFVKCCAVHTPSTNPNKPPALSIYNTLTRPSTLIRQRRSRPARSAAPADGASRSAARAAPASSSSGPSSSRPSAPSARPSAPPLTPVPLIAPVPAPPTSSAAPAVIVVEPPPPYTASADPGSQLGGPKRGHRNNKKRQTAADSRKK